MKLQAQVQQPQAQGWWDTFKETFSLEALSKKFNFSFNNLIEISAYIGIGFITGFLVKKYGKSFLAIVFIAILTISVLSYLNVLTIDWVKAKAILGISETQTAQGLWTIYITWIKDHVAAAVSMVIGFLIGYHVG